MTRRHLNEMVGGWLVGDFEPSCARTAAFEVACKHYPAGATEDAHVHRIATEITLIASGRACMNGLMLTAGDILILEPGEPAEFRADEPTTTVVVKFPSVVGDKHAVDMATLLAGATAGGAR